MKIQLSHEFEEIISIENLLEAWKEFEKGKKNRKDVQEFSLNLMDNIFKLNSDLVNLTYKHGSYQAFKINDPKPRDIHKAQVRDRLLHHAIYRKLYPFFDKTFISDSFSCRLDKGTHKAIRRFEYFVRKESKNNLDNCWILKCDIRKFFASINHQILINILAEYISDKNILWILEEIIYSFNTQPDKGLPLGNLTSQLLVNIYMNKFDRFIKHNLKAKYYIRYADDFVVIHKDKNYLKNLIPDIDNFLKTELNLNLHPHKVILRKYHQGIDFLGYVVLPHYIILRNKTKKRIFKKIERKQRDLKVSLISQESFNHSLQSYLGMLKHCEGYKIENEIKRIL